MVNGQNPAYIAPRRGCGTCHRGFHDYLSAAFCPFCGAQLLPYGLRPREHETMALIGEGLDNLAIAERMGISLRSVENYIHNLIYKMNIRTLKPELEPRMAIALVYWGIMDPETLRVDGRA